MIEKNKLSMLLFLASEVVFFGVLILAYLYYYRTDGTGVNAASVLDPALTGLFTVALLASSVTLWRAQKSMEQQRRGAFRVWLATTVLLGAIFLIGQGWEYAQLLGENVTIDRSLFATTFFTLTGFHGLHVASGLVALMILLGLAFSGGFDRRSAIAVETVELYWHFVDVVWIVIFAIVYLWPFL